MFLIDAIKRGIGYACWLAGMAVFCAACGYYFVPWPIFFGTLGLFALGYWLLLMPPKRKKRKKREVVRNEIPV